jgi:hypothetical protein
MGVGLQDAIDIGDHIKFVAESVVAPRADIDRLSRLKKVVSIPTGIQEPPQLAAFPFALSALSLALHDSSLPLLGVGVERIIEEIFRGQAEGVADVVKTTARPAFHQHAFFAVGDRKGRMPVRMRRTLCDCVGATNPDVFKVA